MRGDDTPKTDFKKPDHKKLANLETGPNVDKKLTNLGHARAKRRRPARAPRPRPPFQGGQISYFCNVINLPSFAAIAAKNKKLTNVDEQKGSFL